MSVAEREDYRSMDHKPPPRCVDEDGARVIEELYLRHRSRVYALCLSMTGNRPDAEDLSQEVFIQLIRKVETFRGESAFSTWLHRLTTNHVLMHFRKRKARIQESGHYVPIEESDVGIRDLRRQASVLDGLWLNRAIRQLPAGKRIVLLLHDVEGYDHEEIARRLGCSVGTSKSQLHKARMCLREILGNAPA